MKSIGACVDRVNSNPSKVSSPYTQVLTQFRPRRHLGGDMTLKHEPVSTSTAWMVQRAFLAMSLMIGFYVFALTIAILLLWIPYAMWVYVGRLPVKLAAASVGAGLTTLGASDPGPIPSSRPVPLLGDRKTPGCSTLFGRVRPGPLKP